MPVLLHTHGSFVPRPSEGFTGVAPEWGEGEWVGKIS